MKNSIDFFEKASSLYLKEEMKHGDFVNILYNGEIVPVKDNFSDWDIDYLEEQICKTANLLKACYDEGAEQIYSKFKIGDKVAKNKGYAFIGEVRSVFTNTKNQIRVVIEHYDSKTEQASGMLHIFNEKLLDKI